jgi:hypothetical protein
MYNTDPNRPVEDILSDIKAGAVQSFQSPMGNSNPGALWAPLAALMVKLSREAEASAERMERLTRRLYVLTVLILVLTLLLLIREIAKDTFEFFEKRHPQSENSQQYNPGISNDQKIGEPAGSVNPTSASPAVTTTPAQKDKKE